MLIFGGYAGQYSSTASAVGPDASSTRGAFHGKHRHRGAESTGRPYRVRYEDGKAVEEVSQVEEIGAPKRWEPTPFEPPTPWTPEEPVVPEPAAVPLGRVGLGIEFPPAVEIAQGPIPVEPDPGAQRDQALRRYNEQAIAVLMAAIGGTW